MHQHGEAQRALQGDPPRGNASLSGTSTARPARLEGCAGLRDLTLSFQIPTYRSATLGRGRAQKSHHLCPFCRAFRRIGSGRCSNSGARPDARSRRHLFTPGGVHRTRAGGDPCHLCTEARRLVRAEACAVEQHDHRTRARHLDAEARLRRCDRCRSERRSLQLYRWTPDGRSHSRRHPRQRACRLSLDGGDRHRRCCSMSSACGWPERGRDRASGGSSASTRCLGRIARRSTPGLGDRALPPRTAGAQAIIQPFPATKPNTPLTGVVTQYVTGGNQPIPADGAVLVARGAQAGFLSAEAPVGANVTRPAHAHSAVGERARGRRRRTGDRA